MELLFLSSINSVYFFQEDELSAITSKNHVHERSYQVRRRQTMKNINFFIQQISQSPLTGVVKATNDVQWDHRLDEITNQLIWFSQTIAYALSLWYGCAWWVRRGLIWLGPRDDVSSSSSLACANIGVISAVVAVEISVESGAKWLKMGIANVSQWTDIIRGKSDGARLKQKDIRLTWEY